MNIVFIEGVKATVQQFKFKFLAIALGASFSLGLIGCGQQPTGDPAVQDKIWATVNGKPIKMQEVERVAQAESGDQWKNLPELQRNQLRIQILQDLIQKEVLFQKAEKEKTLPTEDEVTAKISEATRGKSDEDWTKELDKMKETKETFRETVKKQLAIEKLITTVIKVESPKDSEIEAFYKENPDASVKKKGVKLAIIVVDPAKTGEGDPTVDEATAKLKIQEISTKLNQGVDFATVAREHSEDPSRAQGGELPYIPEDQLKQAFGGQLAGFMNPQVPIGKPVGLALQGKYFFIKLVERSDKDETLAFKDVRQQIIDQLTNARKGLLSQAYALRAMYEAKIDNLLLKEVIENPATLSSARPAGAPSANSNTDSNANSGSNANTGNANTNTGKANNNAKPENKPEPKKPANPPKGK